MRILNVVASLGLAGGERERGYRMSLALAERGHDVTVLTVKSMPGGEPLPDFCGRCRTIALPRAGGRFGVPRVSATAMRSFVGSADVVHLLGHWHPLNAVVYRALRRTRTPYVASPAGSLPAYGRSRAIKELFHRTIGKRILRDAACIVAITADEKATLESTERDIAPVVVIPNGIDPADYDVDCSRAARATLALGSAPYLMFLGRLNAIKGPDLLLEAFARIHNRLPQYALLLGGPDGGLLDQLRAAADRLHIAHAVRFAGPLAGDQKIGALQGAALVVVPSRREAMSIIALEAAMAGAPLLLTDTCGLNDAAAAGGAFVVAPAVDAIAAALGGLLDGSVDLRQRGQEWRAYCLQHFTWDVIVRQYEVMYGELLREASR